MKKINTERDGISQENKINKDFNLNLKRDAIPNQVQFKKKNY
jgi:hypothetical protein